MLMLNRIESPLFGDKTITELDVYVAGYVMSLDFADAVRQHCDGLLADKAMQWADNGAAGAVEMYKVIQGLLVEGFKSAASTRWPSFGGGTMQTDTGEHGNGMGWVLTTIDCLCADYGWTIEYVMNLPMATAFALLTARKINQGAEWTEPSFYERDQDFDGIKKFIEGIGK